MTKIILIKNIETFGTVPPKILKIFFVGLDKQLVLTILDGLTHWENAASTTPAPTDTPWWHYKAPSADVEMTSYALLAHVMGNRQQGVANGIPIVRWMSKQRNPYGGFSSTQVCITTHMQEDVLSRGHTISSSKFAYICIATHR